MAACLSYDPSKRPTFRYIYEKLDATCKDVLQNKRNLERLHSSRIHIKNIVDFTKMNAGRISLDNLDLDEIARLRQFAEKLYLALNENNENKSN